MEAARQKPLSLPSVIPVFPLSGVILLPGSNLPLNIFEPRYLQMVRDAVSSDGLIGMVQPKVHENEEQTPDLYDIGGLGKIDHLVEAGENRFAIRLKGIARFEITDELSTTTPYRQVQVDWSRFQDMEAVKDTKTIDRRRLLATLSSYLEQRGLDADYDAIAEAPDDILVNTLSMIIPLGTTEKQGLLEAAVVSDRAEMLTTLLKMALIEDNPTSPSNLH